MNLNFFNLPERNKPGLFVTGIDSGIGKTVITCVIAEFFSRLGKKVGVLKPFAGGCKSERGNLVSDDAVALAHYAQLDPDIGGGLGLVTPLAHKPESVPAVAMELSGKSLDLSRIDHSLSVLDSKCDVILIEGTGGVMVPLDPTRPNVTMLDFIREAGYPVVVVTKADHSALSHTAMTCSMLRQGLCRTAGLVVNFYNPDNPDPAMQANRDWLSRMNVLPVLATVPRIKDSEEVCVSSGKLHDDIRTAVMLADWRRIIQPPPPPLPNRSGNYNNSGGQWITYNG